MKDETSRQIIKTLLADFRQSQEAFCTAIDSERSRFKNAAKGSLTKAYEHLLEAQEFVSLGHHMDNLDPSRDLRRK
jgi:hypothetical protein